MPHKLKSNAAIQQKAWRDNNPNKCLDQKLRYHFGITLEDYNYMLKNQKGKCNICNQECKTYSRLAVEHCHKTGVIRGLVCSKCNAGLGFYNDNIELHEKAIKHLKGDAS